MRDHDRAGALLDAAYYADPRAAADYSGDFAIRRRLRPAVADCVPPSQLFYGCLPPAIYVPNPGHCEFPPGDSHPPPVYPTPICGVPAIDTKTRDGPGDMTQEFGCVMNGLLFIKGKCITPEEFTKAQNTHPKDAPNEPPINLRGGTISIPLPENKQCSNDNIHWWPMRSDNLCHIEDAPSGAKDSGLTRIERKPGDMWLGPVGTERKPGDMTVDSHSNPTTVPTVLRAQHGHTILHLYQGGKICGPVSLMADGTTVLELSEGVCIPATGWFDKNGHDVDRPNGIIE